MQYLNVTATHILRPIGFCDLIRLFLIYTATPTHHSVNTLSAHRRESLSPVSVELTVTAGARETSRSSEESVVQLVHWYFQCNFHSRPARVKHLGFQTFWTGTIHTSRDFEHNLFSHIWTSCVSVLYVPQHSLLRSPIMIIMAVNYTQTAPAISCYSSLWVSLSCLPP